MILDPALLTASVLGAIGFICLVWLLRQPTKTKIAVGVAYMALYTYALWRAEITPLQPPPETIRMRTRRNFFSPRTLGHWWKWWFDEKTALD